MSTGQLSESVLQQLAQMDDYDRTLNIDRLARENGLTVEQVTIQLRVFQQGGSGTVDPNSPALQDLAQEAAPVQAVNPNYLQDAHRYRVRYDPSHDGQARQAQVNQAILCPHCSAPLGIPAVRPIKVTCPNCTNDAVFHS
jgi:hypothetical protein